VLSEFRFEIAVFVAIGLPILATKLRLSAWWFLIPGVVAVGLMALSYSDATTCGAGISWTFQISTLVAFVSFAVTPVTAVADAIRTGGSRRLLPVVPTVVLAIVGLFLWGNAFGSCME